jgi:hypothetical protein
MKTPFEIANGRKYSIQPNNLRHFIFASKELKSVREGMDNHHVFYTANKKPAIQ